MRLIPIFMAALLAAGCATAPKPGVPDARAWELRQKTLSGVDQWRVGGRISVRTGEEAAHGHLQWQQEGDRYDVRISGPFGSGTVRLAGDPAAATLWVDRQPPIRSTDPEVLLYRQTGWWIPVGALRYWMLGLPDPGLDSERQLDKRGRLERLRQAGWEIRFLDYEQRDGLELPGRIFVSKGEGEVKVALQRWSVPSISSASGDGDDV